MNNRHELTPPGGGTIRTLPDLTDPAAIRRIGSFHLRGQGSGGVTDLAGEITAAEFAEFPDVYSEGATWRVFDDDDGGRCTGRGRLDAPAIDADGKVSLHAEGPCRRTEQDSEARRLWQSRDLGEVSPDDSDPFTYDSDEQITVDIQTREIILGWQRKQAFIRATGNAELAQRARKGDESITIDINGGGLEDEEWIHIGNETIRVANSYSPGSTSIPLKSKLEHDHAVGGRVQWRASGNPSAWGAGFVDWRPTTEITRVAGTLDKNRNAFGAELRIYAGQGPDNVNNLIGTFSMGPAGPATFEINGVPAGTDAIRGRLVNTNADEKADAFRLKIKDWRLNDLAGNSDDYKTHEVVEDVANMNGGGDLSGIENDTENALPLDAEGVPSSRVLDDMAILTGRYWSVEDDGAGLEWFFREWGTRSYLVTDPQVNPKWSPLPRRNVAVVPFRYKEGGYQHWTRQRANPDPFPGESRSITVTLEEPLVTKDIADAIARNVADLAAVERHACRAELLWVESPAAPGVRIPASRLKAGDELIFTLHDDRTAFVTQYEMDDDKVTIDSNPAFEGETGIAALDAVLLRRGLLLARGRSNPWASLHVFDLDEPLPPLDITAEYNNSRTRSGARVFDLIADWSPVLEDINGKGTAVASYFIEARPVWADTGIPVDKRKGGTVRHARLTPRKSNDAVDDDIPTRVVFQDLPNPREWAWQVRGMTTDIFEKKSQKTDWTPEEPVTPTSAAPRAPEDLSADLDQTRFRARWERPDDSLGEGGLQGANLLSVADTGMEAAGTWFLDVGGGGSAIAQVADAAYLGDQSTRVTAPTAGGEVRATTGLKAITGGARYNVEAWALAETTVRNVRVGLHFYTAANVFISTVWGPTQTDLSAAGFELFRAPRLLAPAAAAKCRVLVSFLATGGSGERFYFDEVTLRAAPTTPILDREVAYFRWELFKGAVKVDSGRTRSTHVDVRVKRPGAAIYTFNVWSVNADGDVSTVASITATKLAPPTPVQAPTVTIDADDVPAGQRRAVVKFFYTTTGTGGGLDLGGEGQYADDDVDRFIIDAQTADDAAFTKKVRNLASQVVDYDGLIEYETVFKGIRKGRHFRARYRAADTRNHKGVRSGYS